MLFINFLELLVNVVSHLFLRLDKLLFKVVTHGRHSLDGRLLGGGYIGSHICLLQLLNLRLQLRDLLLLIQILLLQWLDLLHLHIVQALLKIV